MAHEDHPQRALRAALAMQEELGRYAERLRAKGRIPVEARVGVNTGEVVVRSIQVGGHTEYTPVGHVTNLAARMQTAAPAVHKIYTAKKNDADRSSHHLRAPFHLPSAGSSG